MNAPAFMPDDEPEHFPPLAGSGYVAAPPAAPSGLDRFVVRREVPSPRMAEELTFCALRRVVSRLLRDHRRGVTPAMAAAEAVAAERGRR